MHIIFIIYSVYYNSCLPNLTISHAAAPVSLYSCMQDKPLRYGSIVTSCRSDYPVMK